MLTYDQIDDIITNRRFNEMIGKYETDLLDAKSDLYQLKDDYGKSELAKDTSALANHKGGYLIIGLRTEKDKTSLAEIITEFRPFEQQLIAGFIHRLTR
jgi:predicted HTH transcriptional regulator